MSGARPGTKSQLNESVDSQHLGALENRIEVAIVKTDASRSAPEDCASCFEAFDSLFDSLPGAVCDTPGHSVAQTVTPLTFMMVMHALERRHPSFVLAFTVVSSAYGFMSGAWPFGVVELVWTGVAARRYSEVRARRSTD